MILEDDLHVGAPLDRVWAVVCTIPRIAACVPHAVVIGTPDARTAVLRVGVRIGPIAVTYTADLTLTSADPAATTVVLGVDARDKRGRRAVHASVRATLRAHGAATGIAVRSDAAIDGLLAGLGERVIAAVTTSVLDDFALRIAAAAAA